MSECPIYLVNPSAVLGGVSAPPSPPTTCAECCQCGYLQYEGLIPYLAEIKHYLNNPDQTNAIELEFKLREQILEISRLFDIEAGVEPGYFSKAHYATTRTYPTHGTKYIKVGDHVAGTLEVRTTSDRLVPATSYGVQDGFVVYMPCQQSSSCDATCGCGITSRNIQPWPEACYQVTARWGAACADLAVQRAVRDYLIETYRVQDPVQANINGIPITRGFKIPHSWSSYLKNFRDKRAFFSGFGFA